MGLEIAQAHHRLGTNVIVVDAGEPLGREDPEMAAIVLRQLREEGLDIRAHTNVTVVAARGHGVAVTIEKAGVEEVLNGSHLLVAAGRLPATGELGLEKARVAFGPGGIKVDAGLRTTNRRIYAVGDVNGSPAYSYVAQHQGEAVVRNALFGLPASARLETVPFVTYTDPEIASVGMTELQAGRRRSAGFRVLRQSLAENDRALSTRAAEGLVKVVFDARGQVRGASIVGPHAGELITLYAFAIANRLTARHLAGFVAPYPTLSETARQIATAYGKGQPDNPWLTRLAALVRLLP
jgi:pyruvate/2-oxoglutarate dehydrogenase complex dihydrolipoamide dehydrogenase (E3) component